MRDNDVGVDAEDMAALAKALGGVYTNQSTRSLSPYEAQLLSEEIQSKMPNEEPRGFGFYKPNKRTDENKTEENKMLIDGDVSNLEAKSKQTETPVPAMGMSYCCPGIGAANDAYVASAEKSKKVRNGLVAEGRPNTDSLYFGKV